MKLLLVFVIEIMKLELIFNCKKKCISCQSLSNILKNYLAYLPVETATAPIKTGGIARMETRTAAPKQHI